MADISAPYGRQPLARAFHGTIGEPANGRCVSVFDGGVRGRTPYLDGVEGAHLRPAVDRLLTAEEIAERLGMRTDWV
jgi:hypothetical protein